MSTRKNMTLPNFVKPAPIYWRFLPYFNKVRGLLFLNKIYLRLDIYENLISENPDPINEGILIHELTHKKNSQEQGWLKFGIGYFFSRKARLEEELSAIKAQIKFLKSKGLEYQYTERSAKALSSIYYLWAGDYKEIKSRLEKIIREN